MTRFTTIEARWGIGLPDTYFTLFKAGALDEANANYLGNFTAIKEWFDPPRLYGTAVPENYHWKTGLVPFAKSHMADHLAWVKDWKTEHGIGVAFALRASSSGGGYAPNYAGAVYRSVLEELTSTGLAEKLDLDAAGLRDFFRGQVAVIMPVLRGDWAATLTGLLDRDFSLTEYGDLTLFTDAELNDIVARDLAFDYLDVEFKYTRDAP